MSSSCQEENKSILTPLHLTNPNENDVFTTTIDSFLKVKKITNNIVDVIMVVKAVMA